MPTGERTLIVGQINMEHPAAHRQVNGRLVGNLDYLSAALAGMIRQHLRIPEGPGSCVILRDINADLVGSFKWWEPGDTPKEPPRKPPQLRRIK